MKKRHSLIGLLCSILFHATVFASIWYVAKSSPQTQAVEEVTNISIEMLAARLEQPEVAASPEPMKEPEPEHKPEPAVEPEPKPIPEPKPEPPVAVEKPKEKPKDPPKEKAKPKEKPKEKPKKTPKEKPKAIKALEKGPEAKQGVVEKAIPNAAQGSKTQAGIVKGSPSGNATASGNSAGGNELNAYKAQLQKMLQQRAYNAYPQREKMMRKTGTVTLSFSVSSSGQVTNVNVSKSSGNTNLDNAAVKAAQSTRMNSPPPAGFPSSLIVPVRFSIH
ncbi:energy transducer TonB [Glaesserella sp.]|uniref:energy transducer TonB family protein n=1 Tax=Glaesserella sp. TaxID=2094731 RepID=UPI00359FEDD0